MAVKSSERMRPSPKTFATAVALLAALLFLPLALAPRAEAYVYWTNPGAIGRADLDGSGVDQSLVPDVPCCLSSVAVDSDHIYWTHSYYGTNAIGRANLDGTGVDQNFISGLSGRGVGSIEVSGGHLYWINADYAGLLTNSIGRANVDGTMIDQGFIGPLSGGLRGLAVGSQIYWTQGKTYPRGSIGRANLDGTGVDQDFIGTDQLPYGIAVDQSHLYWAEDWIMNRANLDGSQIDRGFINDSSRAVAVDAAHVYWSDGSYRSSVIHRANIDGTASECCFIHTAPQGLGVGDLAVDSFGISELAGTASAKKTQKQRDKQIGVEVKVKAEEYLTAEAAGKIRINPTYKLKRKTAEVAAGKTMTVKLKPKRTGDANKIAEALERGKKATAKLTVKLIDQAGNTETETLSVRLKR